MEKLKKELDCYQEKLKKVHNKLSRAHRKLEEAECQVDRYEEKEDDFQEKITALEKKISLVKRQIKCPVCGYVYKKSNMAEYLHDDIVGEFWLCPTTLCDFKGYKNKEGFYVLVEVLKKERREDFRTNHLANFYTMDKFLYPVNDDDGIF